MAIKAKTLKHLFLILFTVLLATNAFAFSSVDEEEKKGSLKEEIKAYIQHHLKDSHDFYLGSYKDGDKKSTLDTLGYPSYFGIMAYISFHLPNSNTVRQLSKRAKVSTNYITERFTKQMLLEPSIMMRKSIQPTKSRLTYP